MKLDLLGRHSRVIIRLCLLNGYMLRACDADPPVSFACNLIACHAILVFGHILHLRAAFSLPKDIIHCHRDCWIRQRLYHMADVVFSYHKN